MRLDRWLERKARLTRQAVEKVFREKRVLQGREPALPDATVVLDRFTASLIGPKVGSPGRKTPKKGPNQPVAPFRLPNPKSSTRIRPVVVDKPTGITTCRNPRDLKEFGSQCPEISASHHADRLPGIRAKPGAKRPGVSCSPSGSETSGVLVFALNDKAASGLVAGFRKHR